MSFSPTSSDIASAAPCNIEDYSVERLGQSISSEDLDSLIETTTATILSDGVFGWYTPPERKILSRFFEGLLLVPDRDIFVVRHPDGSICGAGVLAHTTANSEACLRHH